MGLLGCLDLRLRLSLQLRLLLQMGLCLVLANGGSLVGWHRTGRRGHELSRWRGHPLHVGGR